MNVWAFDDEPVVSRPRVKKCFADEVEVSSTTGWGDNTQSQRRKQRGKVEFLVEDHQASDDDDNDAGLANKSVKANQISSVEVVDHVTQPVQTLPLKQERQSRKEKKQEIPVRPNQDITVHHLVREFLLMHCHEDVVKILEQERPMPVLDATEVKELSRQLTGTDKGSENPSVPPSLLERFLVCSNEAKVKARTKRTTKERSESVEKTKPSTGRRKPTLNVITNNLGEKAGNVVATPVNAQTGGDYNRLNHPGSTPHHQVHGTVIGEPGSTPMARAKDLRILGFDDVDDDGETPPTAGEAKAEDGTDQLSEYAQRKRNAKTGLKRVQLGNPGSTPTKEYIFFRETPPSFVTETIEDAVEVFEKLGSDPEFVKQAVVIERFIELQSGEVSKYSVGQVVEGLGAQANINGVVSKIYGSRLCGTAGPGAIVIDICPDSSAISD